MRSAAELLASEIRGQGPIPFSQFMETALYHPEHGYYRSPRDPFGVAGDFYTASQLQPVFGRLIAAVMRHRCAQLGDPHHFTVVEWGAGRGELAEHLNAFHHHSVDIGRGGAPDRFEGVVFSNELFDALPVDVVRVRHGAASLMHVGCRDDAFVWIDGPAVPDEWRPYVERARALFPSGEDLWLELPVRLRDTLAAMAAPLARGFIIAIDYGYTAPELVRFPRGTLMSYRRHRAVEDVLRHPGEQDITAHVPFTHLEACAASLGLVSSPLVTLARFLMDAGEPDQFASALAAPDERQALRLRLQLKSLLFGMGATYRCITFRR
ncbi:MAG: SAM-dependent methyltransferase [Candidatus Solibacter usitatus]|nr:SAM-dependent methyltransferase [Candidatus Solibacter usitatus]